jgi:hypothetical protein
MAEADAPLERVAALRGERPVALIDGRNVQRSQWPNVGDEELVSLCCRWARRERVVAVVVFDGRTPATGDGNGCIVVEVLGETADDWLIRASAALRDGGVPFWLVTSDQALRAVASRGAEQVVGGGRFLRNLRTETIRKPS